METFNVIYEYGVSPINKVKKLVVGELYAASSGEIVLYDGEEFKTTTIENGNTTYEFTGLPMYKTDTNGNYILDDKGNVELNEYTVEEVSIDGYTSTQNGFDFVNTINQELILIKSE